MPSKKSEASDTEKPKLPQKKLRDFLNTPITIERIFTGTSAYGRYALLFTSTDAIITSGKVVLKQVEDIRDNLPVTMTPVKVPGKNHEYFQLK